MLIINPNAPISSAYVTIGSDGTLTSERNLTGTTNQIVVTDNGANSTVVLSTPQNIDTAANPTFASPTFTGSLTVNGPGSSSPGILLVPTGSNQNAILRLQNTSTVAGAGGTADLQFYDGSTLGFRFLAAFGNSPAAARYGGFVALQDRDGTNLPLRFFTNDSAGTSKDCLYMSSGQGTGENGPVGIGTTAPSGALHVTHGAPASVSSGNGTNSINLFNFANSPGGATTATGTNTGGVGGAGIITLGTGGAATGSDVASTGGAGGAFTVNTGAGANAAVAGTGNNTGGASGAITLTGGVGGTASGNTTGNNTGGAGGLVFIAGGRGGSASNANATPGTIQGGAGGDMEVRGGLGGAGTGGTAGAGGNLIFKTASTTSLTERARFLPTGELGVGVTSPTAIVHIKAGTTTASTAPLKLNSGTNMTTAETGAIEYNGNFYITNAGLIRYPFGGTIFDHFADAGNTTTGETDLYTDTTAANTLNKNGDKICAEYDGIFVISATATRDLRVYFAGTAIWDSGAIASTTAESWEVRVTIIRESSTVVRCKVVGMASTTTGTLAFEDVTYTRITGLTLSGTNILKITGQAAGVGAATNDIVAKFGFIEFKPSV